jgi:hypothetical protein
MSEEITPGTAFSGVTPLGTGTVGASTAPRLLVLACGALASEILYFTRINGWDHVTLACLPARLHNTPDRIVPELEARLQAVAGRYDKVLIGYADCGTGGHLDSLLERWENVERLPGAHCYEFFATSPVFMELHEAELGTFYLTDFLARHFDRLVWQFLGLDRYPQLRDMYFGNYRKLAYLSQFDDPSLEERAREAAARLGLEFQHHRVGLGELGASLERFAAAATG